MTNPALRDATCGVCGEPVGPAPVLCPDCRTPHHWDCWEYNGGCATYACPRKVRAPGAAPAGPGVALQAANAIALPPIARVGPWDVVDRATALTVVAFPGVVATIVYGAARGDAALAALLAAGTATVVALAALALSLLGRQTEEVVFDLAGDRVVRTRSVSGFRLAEREVCPLRSLQAVEVHWSPTWLGPRLTLEGKVDPGTVVQLTPPFEPGGDVARAVAALLTVLAKETKAYVRGQGNLRSGRPEGKSAEGKG